MTKYKRLIFQKINIAMDDYLYGNTTFYETIARIFFVCYRYLEMKGDK